MKKIIRLIMLLPLVMFLACDETVFGDNPIVVVGDVAYVFVTEDDEVQIRYRADCWNDSEVWVWREIEDGVVIVFTEELYDMREIVVQVDTGNLYKIPLLICQGNDDCHIDISFALNRWSLSS